MKKFARTIVAGVLVSAGSALAFASGPATAVIRKVSLLGAGSNVEIEIIASRPVTPQAQVLTNPYRLVLDFANASMDSAVHALTTPRGPINDGCDSTITRSSPLRWEAIAS